MAHAGLVALVAFLLAACGQAVDPPTNGPVDPGPLALTNVSPPTGDQQTLVTVTGENIAGNAQVTMNGTAAANVTVRDAEDQIVTGATKTGTTATFNPPMLDDGVYDVTVSQGQGEDAESATLEDAFTYETAAVTPGDFSLYINSGGPEVEAGGVTWFGDIAYLFATGGTFTNPVPIENTDMDVIYQSERHTAQQGTFIYVIPVPEPGTYQVVFHFAEIWHGVPPQGAAEAGQRVFDVAINGDTVLQNYDIFVAAGAAATAVTSTHTVEVTGETMNITVTNVEGGGKLSAIEIHDLVDGTNENGETGNGENAE
jgi:hypothetical protein